MSHTKLFDEFKRLLEYSGKPVFDVSHTKDGVTALVYLEGKAHRIFIAPIEETPKRELEAELFTDSY